MAVRQRAAATLPTLMRALRKETRKPPNHRMLPSLRRAFSLYDQINLIDNVPEDQLRFQGYTDEGFTVNGVNYEGSVLCVGNLITSWKPKKFSDVTMDSLSMFQIVRPIPEIFILGCGRHIQQVNPELRHFIRSTGMKLEVLDSEIFCIRTRKREERTEKGRGRDKIWEREEAWKSQSSLLCPHWIKTLDPARMLP